MARVGLYIEQSSAGVVGGAQTLAAVIAEWLSKRHSVDLLIRSASMLLCDLEKASATDLTRINAVKMVAGSDGQAPVELGKGYDVLIAVGHDLPPLCRATVGILIVLFPFPRKEDLWPWANANSRGNWLRGRLRLAY